MQVVLNIQANCIVFLKNLVIVYQILYKDGSRTRVLDIMILYNGQIISHVLENEKNILFLYKEKILIHIKINCFIIQILKKIIKKT